MEIKISKGNSKIGNIPNISLVPIRDCGNCIACADKCYAKKAYNQYPNVREAWGKNSKAFRENPMKAGAFVSSYLFDKMPKYFRIHVAGDFLNQKHVDTWKGICTLQPETEFMVNTKMFNFNYSDIPKNMHLRFSMWPGQEIPEGNMPKAWLQDGFEMRIPANVIECVGNCDNCLVCYTTNKDVVFNIH